MKNAQAVFAMVRLNAKALNSGGSDTKRALEGLNLVIDHAHHLPLAQSQARLAIAQYFLNAVNNTNVAG